MGSISVAAALIRAAATVGADACKFQMFRPEDILKDVSGYDKRLTMNPEWIPSLVSLCEEGGIDFLCTPFAAWSVEALKPYVWAYKVGSFEWNRKDIWEAIEATDKPTIVSFGRGVPPEGMVDHGLYCVSSYPADPKNVYLPIFTEIGKYQGISDHTTSTVVPALAVARGARIVEKHIRLAETTSDCPDFPHSLEPDRFSEMVENIRLAEMVCWRRPPESPELSHYPNRRE